jgi:hypothetical protein
VCFEFSHYFTYLTSIFRLVLTKWLGLSLPLRRRQELNPVVFKVQGDVLLQAVSEGALVQCAQVSVQVPGKAEGLSPVSA